MELFYILLILLVTTRIFGELAVRIKLPALMGELLAGILLGALAHFYSAQIPLFAELDEVSSDRAFIAITDLAVFFLMLMAGLEMHPKEFVENSKGALSVAIGGMLIPFVLGILLGWGFLPASEYRPAQLLYLGTALAVTAVPVSVKVLMELGKLHSRPGKMIVSAALIDDALGLILMAILTAFLRLGELPSILDVLTLLGQILLFFLIVVSLGMWVLPRFGLVLKRVMGPEAEFTGLLVVGLLFAVLAEYLEMHFVVGAFAAGLFFSGRHFEPGVYEDLQRKVSAISTGFLAPIFFASIGLHLDPAAIWQTPFFLLLLIATAFFGKMIGAGLPAWQCGFTLRQSATVGVGMSARATVELVIAKVALEAGLFNHPSPTPTIVTGLFSAVVVMSLTTTILVPFVLKILVGGKENGNVNESSNK